MNIIVLWNTIYMDAALRQLRKEGLAVRDEDVARLSPSGTSISTCSAATPSRYPIGLHLASCRPSGTPSSSTKRRRVLT